jgi:hypothetical protein
LDTLRVKIIIKTKIIKLLYDISRIAYYFITVYFLLLLACELTSPSVTLAIKQTMSRISDTFFITTGAQRVTNTPSFTGCPTIIGSNKKVLKRKQIRPLNQKRRNSLIIEGNCRTVSSGWG